MSSARLGAPPCNGPERAPIAPTTAAARSAPVDVITRAVKVEALKPWSMVVIRYCSTAEHDQWPELRRSSCRDNWPHTQDHHAERPAASTGLVHCILVGPIGPSPSAATRLERSVVNDLRSAPAPKTPPAPVNTATLSSSLASNSRNALTSASAVGRSTAFCSSGRSIVTMKTWPSIAVWTVIFRCSFSLFLTQREAEQSCEFVECLAHINNLDRCHAHSARGLEVDS